MSHEKKSRIIANLPQFKTLWLTHLPEQIYVCWYTWKEYEYLTQGRVNPKGLRKHQVTDDLWKYFVILILINIILVLL